MLTLFKQAIKLWPGLIYGLLILSIAQIPSSSALSENVTGINNISEINPWQEFVISEDILGQGTANGIEVQGTTLKLEEGKLRGEYLSPVIKTPQGFTDIGPHWQIQTGPNSTYTIQIRTSADGKHWDSWINLMAVDELDIMPNGEVFSSLVFIPQTEKLHGYVQIQLLASRMEITSQFDLSELTFFLVDASSGPTTEEALQTQEILNDNLAGPLNSESLSAVAKPTVISRTNWGNPHGQNSPSWRPSYANVHHIIVHHTAGTNTDTDWAARVRSTWSYHTNSRGWGDIGYNYLIDPNGNIYEGRAGGDNVIAGHAAPYNTGTMGVSFLGCFDSTACASVGGGTTPRPAALDAATALIAWKVDQRGLNPQGSSSQNNRTYPVIAGHKDVSSTACPGNNLYSRLPKLRDDVANRLNGERDDLNLSYGQQDNNTISPTGDNDNYYFNGASGQNIEITLDTTSGALDPYLLLYKPDGSLLAIDDDSGSGRNAKLTRVLPDNGRYHIVARSWKNCCTGSYRLQIRLLPSGDSDDNRWLSFGRSLTGTIHTNNDRDVYYFSGTQNRIISIRMNKTSSGLNPYLELYSPAGQRIATNDNGGGSLNAWLVKELPGNGTYRIVARSVNHNSSGTYQISLATSQATNLASNKRAVSSSIEASWLTASKAVDGNTSSRWSSQFRDPGWIYVDLGQNMTFNQVVLKWETAYASRYGIYVQTNAQSGTSNWARVYFTNSGNGGTDTISFNTITARYVLMYGVARGTKWGYSLWEFEVYNKLDALIPLVPPDPDGEETDTLEPLAPLGPTDGDKEVDLSGDGDWGQEDMPLATSDDIMSTTDTAVNYTPPLATITSAPAAAIKQGEPLHLEGTGTDSDGDAIVSYIWYSDFVRKVDFSDQSDTFPTIGDTAIVDIDTTSFPAGTHTIYLQVKDNEGELSELVSVQIDILPVYNTYLPMLIK